MITRIEWANNGPVHLQILNDQKMLLTDIPRAITLQEAARILKKSRRHLYRYMQRGWLRPLAKFSGEFFIDPLEIERMKEKKRTSQYSIPPRLAPYFPDHDLKSLNLNRDRDFILTRLLENGTSVDLKWIKKRFSAKDLHQFILTEAHKHLSPRALRFWELMENISEKRKDPPWQKMGRLLGGAS